MLYYSYISSKMENSVLGNDANCFLMAYFVFCSKMESGYQCYDCNEKFDLFSHLIEKHNAETIKIKKLKFCEEKKGVLRYTTVNYKFKPLDNILAGKNVVLAESDIILIKDSISIEIPSPRQSKQFRPSSNANTSMECDSEFDSDRDSEFDSDEEDITANVLELSMQVV